MNRFRCVCLLVLIGGLLAVGMAEAQHCGSRVIHRQAFVHHAAPVVHNNYVAPVVVAEYVPVYVPVYSVGYSPVGTGQESLQLQLDILKLKLELERFKAGQLQPNQPQQPQPQPQPQIQPQKQSQALPDGAKLLVAKCAACHDSSTKQKGGGLAISQANELLPMDGSTQARVMKELYSGRMPRGSKLTDEEVGSIFSYLDAVK